MQLLAIANNLNPRGRVRYTAFDMSAIQTWDPNTYAKNTRFVSDLGAPVLELLSPRPGERILDLGCGDGLLTKKIAELGCDVVGVDSSVPQLEAAKKLCLEVYAMNIEELPYREEFDAVFSNAVLHWIGKERTDAAIDGVFRALRSFGRFVAECGGDGCVDKIRTALMQAFSRRGIDGQSREPCYFPTPGDYATRLERAGFRVNSIALIPRPTALPGDIVDWLETFAQSLLAGLSGHARDEYLNGDLSHRVGLQQHPDSFCAQHAARAIRQTVCLRRIKHSQNRCLKKSVRDIRAGLRMTRVVPTASNVGIVEAELA